MNVAQISTLYERYIAASPHTDNAERLWKEATESPEKFYLILGIWARQNRVGEQVVEPLVAPIIIQQDAPIHLPQPVMQVEVPNIVVHPVAPLAPVPHVASVPPVAPVPLVLPVRDQPLLRQQLEHLNTLAPRPRRQAIDALGLNAVDRKSLVNRLWRLRHPDEVRQNARRSYQNRRNLNT